MAKKSFNIENPAEQFISKPIENEPKEKIEVSQEVPQGYKLNPEYVEKYIEKKDRRLQLLLQPSLYNAIKSRAERKGKSVNQFIHDTLAKEINENE